MCAALLLSSCGEVPGLRSSAKSKNSLVSKSKGNGPPDHAPAWGYRRKHGGAAVTTQSEAAVAGAAKEAAKSTGDKDDDDNDKTKLIVAGAAVAAGTVYAVVNERDKAKTKAEMEEIRQEMNVVTVNVTNSNGSISQVRLQKQGVGYIGPKGEFYDHLPTDEELRATYGL
jgi:hypothetical protein